MVAGPASFGEDDALDRAESGTAPGSPLGEAFSWLHSAENRMMLFYFVISCAFFVIMLCSNYRLETPSP